MSSAFPPLPPAEDGRPAALMREHALDLAPANRDHRLADVEVLDFRQLRATLKQSLQLIARIAAVTVFIAVALTLVWKMRFASKARLYLGELEDKTKTSNASDDAIDLADTGHGDLISEIEILKSRSLVNRAILASGLNARLEPAGHPPPRYWRWLLARRSPGLLDVAAKEVVAINTFLADRSVPEADYVIRFSSADAYDVLSEGQVVGHGRLGDPTTAGGLSITLLPGTKGGPAAGASYDLEVRSLDDVSYDTLKALEITTPGSKLGTGDAVKVATLEFTDKSPRLASKFLDNLMRGYLEERHSWKTENATAAEKFVTSQLRTVQDSLDDVQRKLADYRKNNRVVVLDNQATALVEQVGKYDEQRVEAQLEVQTLNEMNEQLKKPNPPLESFMLGEAKDSVLTALAGSLVQAQQRLAEADARYKAPAPEVLNLREEVDAQLRAVRSYVNNRLNRDRANLKTLEGVITQYEDRLRTVPAAEVGLAQLSRESEVYSAMYSFLLKRQQEMAIVQASTISKNRVLDPPEVPYREEWPKPWLALAGLPLGLFLGAFFVILRALFSGRIQSAADVPVYFGHVPVLATVPHFTGKIGLDAQLEPRSLPYVEAFRALRTNLWYACPRERGNVVMITSPCHGDGKTTSAFSLALALARAGRSVLLVDAHRSAAAPAGSPPDAEPEQGDLASVLEGKRSWRQLVEEVGATPNAPFHVMRRGRASSELLSGVAMRDFVLECRDCYDFVIVDAPSYPDVSDALVLAAMVDCILAVIRPQHTTKRQADENVRRLSTGRAVYGLILNDVRA